jgi:O-methyltransferase involved in polyketide biosynthesis
MPRVSPPGIDVTRPNIARVYDYLLGGKDNFAADREQAEQMIRAIPGIVQCVRDNREFLCAATAKAAREGGVAQFLDLGAGLPASPALHEAARAVIPGARFAIVDIDPVVISHAHALLGKTEGLAPVLADLTEPEALLGLPDVKRVIDFGEPAGIILGSVAHFLPTEQVREVTRAYLSRFPSGSWLIISVGNAKDEARDRLKAGVYTTAKGYSHSPTDLASFFDGTQIVPPGFTEARRWVAGLNTQPPNKGCYMLCGAGIKR